MKHHCVNRVLSSYFTRLGYLLGRYPLRFIIFSVLTTAVLSCGFYFVTVLKDVDGIYSPNNGRTRADRMAVESLFPFEKNVDPARRMRFGRMGILILEMKNSDNILEKEAMEEVRNIDDIVLNVSVVWKNRTFTYTDLCAKTTFGGCFNNDVLSLYNDMEDMKRKKFRYRFPVHRDSIWHQVRIFALGLGGVKTDDEGYIEIAKAVRLFYLLNNSNSEGDQISDMWEEAFLETVSKINGNRVNIFRFVGSTVDKEFNKITETALPLLFAASFIMVAFAVITCMTNDWVSSKPWVGIAGCVTPLFGVASAFGLLLFCGMEYVDINISIPFLLLGIGLDDSFVLLAAWRRTSSSETVEKRMGKTYSGAAVSITITSLTNFLSFCVAITTPFRVIQIYSTYAALSVLMTYIYEITFFGALLAISGLREQKNIHSVFFFTVKPEHVSKSLIYRLLYVGWSDDKAINPESEKLYVTFYRDKLGSVLTISWIKALIVIIFAVYISGASYSLRFMKEGLDFRSAVQHSSYFINFLTKINEHFSQYPHAVQIVINKTLDYSDPQVQADVNEIVANFSQAPNMAGKELTESWLSYFLATAKNERLWFLFHGYNLSNPEDFVRALQEVFLSLPYSSKYKEDLVFSKDRKQITASRFVVFSKNVNDIKEEKDILLDLWKVQDSCKYPVYIHNIWFVTYNQHVVIMETTLHSLCITVGLLVIVLLLFIPSFLCAICVVLAIVSTQVGVMGYMALWNVRLDTVSMVCLIICAGLSIDYSAHISYAYITCPGNDIKVKVREALWASGHPIVQGCISTILGVIILGFGACDIFSIFTKVIFLVMLFSCFHSLFLLLVLLSVWETCFHYVFRKQVDGKVERLYQLEGNSLMEPASDEVMKLGD